jgi:hypothetical protein
MEPLEDFGLRSLPFPVLEEMDPVRHGRKANPGPGPLQ